MRGAYLINAGNPRRPNFNDFRRDSGMRLLISLALLARRGLAQPPTCPTSASSPDDAGAWPEILSSIGLERQPAAAGARLRGARRRCRFRRMERAAWIMARS